MPKAEQGFYSMDEVAEIAKLKSLDEAKKRALDMICRNAKPKMKASQKEAIEFTSKEVKKSPSIKSLALSLSNFILAYEGLRVIK